MEEVPRGREEEEADGGKGESDRTEGFEMLRFKKNEYFVVMLCTFAVTNPLKRWNCSIRSGFVSCPLTTIECRLMLGKTVDCLFPFLCLFRL